MGNGTIIKILFNPHLAQTTITIYKLRLHSDRHLISIRCGFKVSHLLMYLS